MRKLKKSTSWLKGHGEVWYKKGTVWTTTSHFCTHFVDSIYGYISYLWLPHQRLVHGRIVLQSIFQDKVKVVSKKGTIN